MPSAVAWGWGGWSRSVLAAFGVHWLKGGVQGAEKGREGRRGSPGGPITGEQTHARTQQLGGSWQRAALAAYWEDWLEGTGLVKPRFAASRWTAACTCEHSLTRGAHGLLRWQPDAAGSWQMGCCMICGARRDCKHAAAHGTGLSREHSGGTSKHRPNNVLHWQASLTLQVCSLHASS